MPPVEQAPGASSGTSEATAQASGTQTSTPQTPARQTPAPTGTAPTETAPVGTAPGALAPKAAAPLPPQQEIEKHETYRSEPDLQETAGGGLVVNAFIMDGPVHVEVRDRKSGKLLLEKRAETLFPFEIPRRQLGVQMTQVVVKIYVKGKLAHELTVEPGH